ncbi:MAG: hypothetical protein AB1705_18380 [Verrucomicrobiota bacterium]
MATFTRVAHVSLSPEERGGEGLRERGSSILRLLFCLTLCLNTAHAAETPSAPPPATSTAEASPTNAVPKFQVTTAKDTSPTGGEINRGIIVARKHQFSFVLPPAFLAQTEASQQKLMLVSRDKEGFISAHIHETDSPAPELKPEALRSHVLEKFPNGRIVDEFAANLESLSGPAFAVQWRSPSGLVLMAIVARVPYQGGYLEFNVSAPVQRAEEFRNAWFSLLLSFRTSRVGEKLEVQQFLPDL